MNTPWYALRWPMLAALTLAVMPAVAAEGGGPVEEIRRQGRQALATLTAELSRRAGHVPAPAARRPRPEQSPSLRIARTGTRRQSDLTLARYRSTP